MYFHLLTRLIALPLLITISFLYKNNNRFVSSYHRFVEDVRNSLPFCKILVRPLVFFRYLWGWWILKLKIMHFILPSDNVHLLLQSSDLRESKPFCRTIRDFLCYLTSSNYDSKNRHLKKQHETRFFTKYIRHRAQCANLRNFLVSQILREINFDKLKCKSPSKWKFRACKIDFTQNMSNRKIPQFWHCEKKQK